MTALFWARLAFHAVLLLMAATLAGLAFGGGDKRGKR